MTKEIVLALIGTLFSSTIITTLLTMLLNKRKTAAEVRQIESSTDGSVLAAQHALLEKLLERSQKLVEDNEKLQIEYGDLLVKNAELRSEIISRDAVISTLQRDTKAMRVEVHAILNRVQEIDSYLSKLDTTTTTTSTVSVSRTES